MKESNPIIRVILNGRATPAELRAALPVLMEQEALADIAPPPKSPQLVIMAETIEEAKKQKLQGDGIVGLSTGYASLDRLTRGIGKGEIVVVFGDTSHGKSQLAQNITLNLATDNIPVLFVGLEMTNTENTVRFMNMTDKDIYGLPILYPASGDIGYKDIDGLVRAAVGHGVQLVVIDHLHMFGRDVVNLANELSLICHEFKRVARAYEVPIMVISHINRGTGPKGIPELRDLKGSSSIEQDADIALAVWRDMNEEDVNQTLTIRLRKNRLRGRKHTHAELAILDNARLGELVLDIFPRG